LSNQKKQSVNVPAIFPPWAQQLGLASLLVIVTLLAYLPALHNGFIWDDDRLVTDNPMIHSPDGLRQIWFSTKAYDYWPLTYSDFWVEWRLWGNNPLGYHAVNVLLHIAASLLIWIILRRLAIPGAFLAAMLFAVHPINVESVAWIAQRKNTLAMLFFLLSILWYLKEERTWYWLSLLAFAAAMLSKGSVAILPMLLLLILWWRRGLSRKDWLATLPFFLVAIAMVCVNIWFQHKGSSEAIRDVTPLQRMLGAGAVIWFYLYKALLPINLIFVYPQWNIRVNDPIWWLPLLAAMAVTAILWLLRRRPWAKAIFVAWCFFCISLLPVMGLTDVYFMKFSLVADHYQHIAIIGVVVLIAAAWGWWWHASSSTRVSAIGVAALVVGGLEFLSFQQNEIYHDNITLYQATLDKNPSSALVHNNLGSELDKIGRSKEALQQYQIAVRIDGSVAGYYDNIGRMLQKLGQLSEAIENFQQAVRMEPNAVTPQFDLADALRDAGRLPEAIEHYQRVLQINSSYAPAHRNLGIALARSGQPAAAMEQFQLAVKLNPDDPEARNNLGIILGSAGQLPAAAEQFQEALRLRPNLAEAAADLALVYARMQRPDDAIAAAQRAVSIAQSNGQTELAQKFENWLIAYRAAPLSPQNPQP
jgi:tetratricopeptide (TPR) repeat protein